jgi:hypothetical protein
VGRGLAFTRLVGSMVRTARLDGSNTVCTTVDVDGKWDVPVVSCPSRAPDVDDEMRMAEGGCC